MPDKNKWLNAGEIMGDSYSIEMPKSGFSEAALENRIKLVESKAGLIKKAVGVESLSIKETENTLHLPWFSTEISPDEVNACVCVDCFKRNGISKIQIR